MGAIAVISERLALIIDAKTGGAIKEFSALESKVGKTQQAAGGLSGALQKMGLSASSAGKVATIGIAGAATAVTTLAGVAAKSIGAFVQLADDVRGLKRTLGGTAEDASKVAAELRAFGISAEDASKGLFRFARNAGDPAALRKFGVEVARNADGTSDLTETLHRVGDAYRGTADASQRAMLVQAAFGRGGQVLVPILMATRDQLAAIDFLARNRGQILSDEELTKARLYKSGLRQINEEKRALFEAVGKTILPDTTQFAAGVAVVRNLFSGKSYAASLQAGGAVFAAAEADAQKALIDEATAATDKLISAAVAAKEAQLGLASAERGVGDAERALTATRRELAQFDKNFDAKLTGDRLSLASATRGVGDAERALVADKRALVRLQQDLERGAIGEAEADRTLRGAVLDLADAQQRLGDDQERLAKLRAGPDANDVADAQLRIEEATKALDDARKRASRGEGDSAENAIAINRANLDLARSQEALAKLQADSPESLRALSDAQRQVERDTLASEQANIGLGTAQLDAATAGTIAAEQLSVAKQKIRADEDAVTASTLARNAAEQTLIDDQTVRADTLAGLRSKEAEAEDKLKAAKLGVFGAADKVNQAEDALQKLVGDNPTLAKALGDLENMGDHYDTVSAKVDQLRGKIFEMQKQALNPPAAEKSSSKGGGGFLGGLFDAVSSLAVSFLGGIGVDVTPSFLNTRAAGGPVSAGGTYLVGERGPELLRMGSTSSGFVHPNAGASAAGSSGGTTHVHVGSREVADVIIEDIRQREQRGGPVFSRR